MDTAVVVVKAYLELCGYFALTELPVRKRDKRGYHDVTDIDILAVRFPHQPHSLKQHGRTRVRRRSVVSADDSSDVA